MNTRLIAAKVLSRVLNNGQSLTAVLDEALPSVPSAKDRAFIQALCFGVCRTYHRLDFILNELVEKPIKSSQIRVLALVGLYQLSQMRVKPHAAVSETVSAAVNKTWAKALINAVLRSYLREREVLEQKADFQDSSALSHPDWLIGKIRKSWPEQAARIFQENNRQPPMTLRVNLARISREKYLKRLSESDLAATAVDFCPTAILLAQPLPVELLPGFNDGLVSVQDTAAQLAAHLLNVLPGQRVLDVCAAPGGKTAHILETQSELSALVAVDIDAARLQRVKGNLQRLKLTAELVAGDAASPHQWWDGRLFDRILVDAPCSALGVIRRHPDIKLLRKPDDIDSLRALQKKILHAVWPLLRPGGMMLYATCSILKQENEQQMADFIAEHDDAAEMPIIAPWGLKRIHGRQILTGDSAMDGFYYALLAKR
ncbi:MAG: 16S rRNA (cytosine(967)-C(5))-methyltransferase RsmB [Gammaproteobacteria bacterium]